MGEELQQVFLSLLRHVVIELNHVPCKELASLALTLREGSIQSPFARSSLQTLRRLLLHDVTFQDVYRDVGLLEVLAHKFVQVRAKSSNFRSVVNKLANFVFLNKDEI